MNTDFFEGLYWANNDRLIRTLTADNERLTAGAQKACERIARMEEALELIAAPKRPDGTYNRSREACEALAREALKSKAGVDARRCSNKIK